MIKKITFYTIGLFSFLWILKEIVLPVTIAALYSEKFMELTYKCDTAMDDSWYYTQGKSKDKAEQIQMLDCHEYDKTRKILLMSGLPDSYTSWLGLKSLDIYQRPAEEYVKEHRFRER